MQQRLKKYSRDAETAAAVSSRQITNLSLAIIATIHDYKIIPTSLIVRLVPGHEKSTYRHLQRLYHKGLINRFAFMLGRNPSEFYYYLDNVETLDLLVAHGAEREALQFVEVRRNLEKRYCDINNPGVAREIAGRHLFLNHEIMISRFHAMLELACNKSKGRAELTNFQQGPSLWQKVEVPRFSYRNGQWREMDETEILPHRPDAFFTLRFPKGGDDTAHFFYEADRHRTNTTKYNKKLRAHFHFIVKQKRLQETYGINRIRAVLTETVDDEWAERLRSAATDTSVSGSKPSPLFWFTTSRLFEEHSSQDKNSKPRYLEKPEIILSEIWATPVDDTFHSLTS